MMLGWGDLSPVLQQLIRESIPAAASLILSVALLYLSIYANLRGQKILYRILTLLAFTGFICCHYVTPIHCGPVRSLQNFCAAIGGMKLLDLFSRRDNFPEYIRGPPPRPEVLSLILLTELRYESFIPNHIRVPKHAENFSEPLQLAIHTGFFCFLQALPQSISTVLAFEVLLSIYVIWTTLQQILRYSTSPALFGPLYLADSLTGFWSETWHNAFAAPCSNLAYTPIRTAFRHLGAPDAVAKGLGVIGAFGLMAIFHVYALIPIVSNDGLVRVFLFFVINGIATVGEAAIWGRKKSWLRGLLAWSFETALATWTVQALHLPQGLWNVPWFNFCSSTRT